jgi:predicted dehydrogenase
MTLLLLLVLLAFQEPLRVGIIGTDTSHVPAFTKMMNEPGTGVKVVAAFKGGSPDVEASATRVEKFAQDLVERWGVELVDSVPALVAKVDVVLLMSVDGRPHLEQARPVFAAKKRMYIDKPLAGSWKDGVEIARLSKESGTPFFSASSVRFYETMTATRTDPAVGKVLACDAFSPMSIEPHHPDLFWYGIHGVEALYSVLGAGCESVVRVRGADGDLTIGRWKDGRTGVFRGLVKGAKPYGITVYGEKGVKSSLGVQGRNGYHSLVGEIIKFFKGGEPPVSVEEMIEVLAFMQAADLSKERGGAPVRLDELK